MRDIYYDDIKQAVSKAVVLANRRLPEDLCSLIGDCASRETSPLASSIFGDMAQNLTAAEELGLPICQDTGMAVVFANLGQDAHITGGLLEDAVNAGVAEGYVTGLLRCSVVADPFLRDNTGDNSPAVLHVRLVQGDRLTLTVAPKGFGSENMSALRMFTPAATRDDIISFVVETVRAAGGNPCPPVVLGVGVGGDFELCAILAKRALCRPVSERSPIPFYAQLEEDMLSAVNALGIGAQGFGGDITALAVNIERYPTHIAGLPVAVNVGCHVSRHYTVTV